MPCLCTFPTTIPATMPAHACCHPATCHHATMPFPSPTPLPPSPFLFPHLYPLQPTLFDMPCACLACPPCPCHACHAMPVAVTWPSLAAHGTCHGPMPCGHAWPCLAMPGLALPGLAWPGLGPGFLGGGGGWRWSGGLGELSDGVEDALRMGWRWNVSFSQDSQDLRHPSSQ